jgi:hypothetical protein
MIGTAGFLHADRVGNDRFSPTLIERAFERSLVFAILAG